jgi:uncharacterized protein
VKSKYAAFAALDPFFDVIQTGLAGLVDGKHYFDTIADDAVFEFRYDFPDWPRRTENRDALMALYRGYGDQIVLNGAGALVVHPCRDGRVVVLEYEVYGRVLASDAIYENRFVSIANCVLANPGEDTRKSRNPDQPAPIGVPLSWTARGFV